MLEYEIVNNLIDKMFGDRIEELTKEEREIEIMKFREGLAPDRPSFIVNQEDVVKKLKDSFEKLYLKSLNMESWMLVSDYGNGKSHILNTIKSNLEPIKNNIIISIYAKAQNPFYPIQEILKHINREIIRKNMRKYIIEAQGSDVEQDIQINNIMTNLGKSKDLSKLLWYMANGNIEEQIKSLDILTQQDISKEILKELKINDKANILNEITEFFYILIKCLKKENIYVIVLVEEFENVFKWKKKEKTIFYEQLKELMNNSTLLGNMFFMLVATNIFNEEIEDKRNKAYEINGIDPAIYDRLKAKILQLKSIQKSEEALKLINKIKERYELFFNCKLDENKVMEQLSSRLKNINYRSYIQSIALIIDDMIEGKLEEHKLPTITFESKVKVLKEEEECISDIQEKIKSEVNASTSIAIKKKFISAISFLLEMNEYKVNDIKIKSGYIIARPKNKRNSRLFVIAYSSVINSAFVYKKMEMCEKLAYDKKCDKNNMYFIYCKSSVSEKFYSKIKSYNPAIIKTIPLEDDDLTRILLLLEENEKINYNQKRDIALEYGKHMNLEVEDKNE